jgi:hypothetical protein
MARGLAAPAAHDIARDGSPLQRDATWVSRLVSSPGRRPICCDHDSDRLDAQRHRLRRDEHPPMIAA